MFATMGDFELNGEPPDLSGKICQGLYREEYWFEGDLIEPATILYLKFDGQWHRLYFDFGIIFWRLEDELPESFDVPEEGWSFKMIDVNRTIPVVGRCLEQY
ncbi:MAG: hypothetical protein H6637_03610 [Ardenticatenales bacterium]|nr:hypothetical protein [Ardenticatenales bacterium]